MYKKVFISAIAASFLLAPAAQAQSRHEAPRHGYHYSQKPGYHSPSRQVHKPQVKRNHWARGSRVPEWQRRQHVRDYHRHGLKRPARGQSWVKVDDRYLLISMATGVVAALATAR